MESVNETNTVQTAETGGKKPFPKAAGIALAACGAAAAVYLGLCAYASGGTAFYPGARLGGVDVGGMSAEAAQTALEESVLHTAVTLTDASGETIETLTLQQLGYTVADFDGAAQAALDEETAAPFLARGGNYLSSLLSASDLRALPAQSEAKRTQTAEKLADALSYPPQDTAAEIAENGKLTVTVAKDGRSVSPQAVRDALDAALSSPNKTAVLAAQSVPARAYSAQELHDQLAGELANASYDAETDTILPEHAGVEFDVAAAQAALDAAGSGETVELAATVQQPAVTEEMLRDVLFRDVLGRAQTHVGGTAARKSNVKLASSACSGVVLNSGETFSYNGTVGQRTVAKGYQPAPAYVKGETVDEIGGGVCQPSSTLYLACLLADMEITERHAHRYAPSYITWGMDATVSWGGPDFQFTNNTDYPVKIVATYKDGYLTMELLGTNVDGKSAKMTNKVLSSTPWKTVYQDDPTMAPGAPEVVKVTPYTGYKVETYHTIYDKDGNVIDSHFEAMSNYYVRDKVILRAPVEETPDAGEPTPVEPTPVDPTPVDPTPVDPTPVDPTPVDPTPVEPTPVEPTPVEPAPSDAETPDETPAPAGLLPAEEDEGV